MLLSFGFPVVIDWGLWFLLSPFCIICTVISPYTVIMANFVQRTYPIEDKPAFNVPTYLPVYSLAFKFLVPTKQLGPMV